jgi:hypothetical protein
LLREISSRELTEWMAYDRFDPIGHFRSDIQAALLASVIANVNRDPRKRRRPYEIKDFLLRFEPEPVMELSIEETVAFVRQLNRALGGTETK